MHDEVGFLQFMLLCLLHTYSYDTVHCFLFISTSPHNKALHLSSDKGQQKTKKRIQIAEVILPTYRSAISQAHLLRTWGEETKTRPPGCEVEQSAITDMTEWKANAHKIAVFTFEWACLCSRRREAKEEDEEAVAAAAAAEEVATKIRGQELRNCCQASGSEMGITKKRVSKDFVFDEKDIWCSINSSADIS